MNLGKQGLLGVDIHADMHHVGTLEFAIRKGHGQCAALPQRHPVGQSHPIAQHLTRLHIFRCEINACDLSLISGRRKPRPTAKAAPDIQHCHACIDIKLVEKVRAGDAATNMKFVNRSQIVDRDPVWTQSKIRQAVLDCLQQIAVAIVRSNLFIEGHVRA